MKNRPRFRIWDKEEGRFFTPIYEAFEGRWLDLSIETNGRILRHTLKFPAEDESQFEDRYEIQEYADLKSKDGDRIFEGDILAFKSQSFISMLGGEGLINRIGVVEWDREELQWWVRCGTEGFKPNRKTDNKQFKIIGNIYQNPDLIKP
jgi:uncharacterized phage protein (TIGR01671 family)